MAQKIGLAILALLGLANCGIYAGVSDLHYYHQVGVSHGSESPSSSASHPVLGEKEVKLGYGILSFANSQGRNEHQSARIGLRKENDSNRHGEKDSNNHREQNSNSGKYHGRREAASQERPAQKVQIRVVNPPVVVVRSEQRSAPKRNDTPKKPATVYVPVFGNLRHEENSNSGLRQASNIVVTAPLISTDKVDSHRVGYNERVGKSNCPQCREDKKQAAETKQSSEKAIQKNTDKLTTTIKGPINHVEVDTIHTVPKHQHRHRGDNSDHEDSESDSCDSDSSDNSASHHSK